MEVTKSFVSNKQLNLKLKKGVFAWSYCRYGNLLCPEGDNNVFTNDWAFLMP